MKPVYTDKIFPDWQWNEFVVLYRRRLGLKHIAKTIGISIMDARALKCRYKLIHRGQPRRKAAHRKSIRPAPTPSSGAAVGNTRNSDANREGC